MTEDDKRLMERCDIGVEQRSVYIDRAYECDQRKDAVSQREER